MVTAWKKRKKKDIFNLMNQSSNDLNLSSLEISKIVICGSVDDGKSTLLGRIAFEKSLINSDEISRLKEKTDNSTDLNFANLTDGLEDEQLQGITIDVAYKYFKLENLNLIIADSPGHEQYLRNMFTAASTSEIAILLIDSEKGVSYLTKKHLLILSIVGIKKIIVAINKIDIFNYAEKKYLEIQSEVANFIDVNNLFFDETAYVPVSALNGTNVTSNSNNTSWYKEESVFSYMVKYSKSSKQDLRYNYMYISNISVKNDFRGIQGVFKGKSIKQDEEFVVHPSGQEVTVKKIYYGSDEVKSISNNLSIQIQALGDKDISVGDLIYRKDKDLLPANNINGNIINLSTDDMHLSTIYQFQFGTKLVNGRIVKIKKDLSDINLKTNIIGGNNIKEVEILLHESVILGTENSDLSKFIIINKNTKKTVGAGVVNFSLMRNKTITDSKSLININNSSKNFGFENFLIWFTGISGSGKTTLAIEIQNILSKEGIPSYIIDGDNIRKTLNSDLGFSDGDRSENARRVSEVSKIIYDAGVVPIISLITPYESDRSFSRSLFKDATYIEIYLKASEKEVKRRDPKGLYKYASGNKNLRLPATGTTYEEPTNSDVVIDTEENNIHESVELIKETLKKKGVL
tara:strand:- start:2131 stop:4026 length:1896 start_codon:yes stop_codon:yes gene_type:complete